ncbi:subtilisin-like protein [Coprinopsis marcescibilis]|uniref:Subtilisin-like protein n=1 Tax=Coprinopsis marcescibilis TaxID=230819 RepID=A0A5C3KIR9_COPMA|nr:subtilisin-like protein [Coprinopsis marcescibilis]
MHLIKHFAALSLLLPSIVALPSTLHRLQSYNGATTGKYIVELKPGVSRKDFLHSLQLSADGLVEWDVINGFAATIDEEAMALLQSSNDVLSVAEDGHIINSQPSPSQRPVIPEEDRRQAQPVPGNGDDISAARKIITRTDGSWALGRVANGGRCDAYSSIGSSFHWVGVWTRYDNDTAGNGVDIYIVDSGIWENHVRVQNSSDPERQTHLPRKNDLRGRVRVGVNTYEPGKESSSPILAGTHAAVLIPVGILNQSSVAAGARWGFATNANVISVIVSYNDELDKRHGTVAQLISGLDWISKNVKPNRPSVVHISTRNSGYAASVPLDNAVENLVNAGIHVVVGAGDDGEDVAKSATPSPARVPSVITVGGTDILETVTLWSNYGAGVDIFAPGAGVAGAVNTIDSTYTTASSLVTGVVAHLLVKHGALSPAALKTVLVNTAAKNCLSKIRLLLLHGYTLGGKQESAPDPGKSGTVTTLMTSRHASV